MNLIEFKTKLAHKPFTIEFAETITLIDSVYEFAPSEFSNGDIVNKKNENNGSCKIFAFAQDQQFSQEETLSCFGKYYTNDVLNNPDGNDHQNIRNFMKYGWDGIVFNSQPLHKIL